MAAGRDPSAVTLVAVTKSKTAEEIRLAATAGVTDFGENYVQEALAKKHQLGDLRLIWHFIGRIQSNKTRDIAAGFDWVHSVDRLGVARRLSEQTAVPRPAAQSLHSSGAGAGALQGRRRAAGARRARRRSGRLPQVRLRGLMCVPPPQPQPDSQAERMVFARLRNLLEDLNAGGFNLDTLSMGMSADFESAIAEGATMVRIGTALFGNR